MSPCHRDRVLCRDVFLVDAMLAILVPVSCSLSNDGGILSSDLITFVTTFSPRVLGRFFFVTHPFLCHSWGFVVVVVVVVVVL